jgi:predicted AlkP superfamily phosphohydrolase/phosphomutase
MKRLAPFVRRRVVATLAVLVAFAAAAGLATFGCARRASAGVPRRVIILGLDGMDFDLASKLMAEGRLPGLARLSKMGGFAPLLSAVPPQSPVAWSDFITGMDAGGHGIFDFIHRDPKTMALYLSTSRTEPPGRILKLGGYQFPLSGGKVELLRRGQAFWEVLERRGIPTTIMRIPANFPPSGTAGHELSGMGTPDVLGGYGTFSYYTTDRLAFLGRAISGGEVLRVEETGGVIQAKLYGPDNPFHVRPQHVEDPHSERASAEFSIYVDPDRPVVKLVVGGEERVLAEGEWSDWVPVDLPLIPTQSLKAQARFYLKSVRPELALYVSPLNFDALAPALPISTPASFAAELARATGRYYTQGMPENTGALKAGVFSTEEFLEQANIAGQEVLDQYPHVLGQCDRGLLFYYFGNVDLVSHMLWRPMDPGHPAYDPVHDPPLADAVPRAYAKLDGVVSYTLDHMGSDTLLIAMSDHGFTSWRRVFHLNSWLYKNHYLAVRDESLPEKLDMFRNVDWSQTRAYGLGLNGLYVNVNGREQGGIVAPEDRERLVAEIGRKLLAEIDPATGQPAVAHVYPQSSFLDGGQRDVGPDLVVGYAKHARGSDESALGLVDGEILTDNKDVWSGDHCMDPPAVPGILATSRPLKRPVRSLKNLAAAILAEYGVESFPVPRH